MVGGILRKLSLLIVASLRESVPVDTSFWNNLYIDLQRLIAGLWKETRSILTDQVPLETAALSNAFVDARHIATSIERGARDLFRETVPVDTGGSEDRRWFLMLILPVLCTVLVCMDQEMMPKEKPELKQVPMPVEQEEPRSSRMLSANIRGMVSVSETAVYAAKDRKSPQRLSLSYGTRVDPVDASADWVSVKAGGTEGFVPRKDLVLYDKTKKYIALTFDDGPSVSGTKHILDVFQKTGARGTFFVLGSRVNKDTAPLLKRANAIGCQIGNHSWDHAYLPGLSTKKIRRQFARTDVKIKKQTGRRAAIIRPPYGATSYRVRKVAGRPLILWSVDTEDWKYRNTKRLIRYVRSHKRNGAVILMHDIHPSTVRAVASIVRDLKASGYQMVTISELAAIRGVRLVPGKTYLGL